MSGFNSHGVAAAACAKADVASVDVASPVRAAAIKKVLVENRVIFILPAANGQWPSFLVSRWLEQITNAINSSMPPSPHRVSTSAFLLDFVISRVSTSRL